MTTDTAIHFNPDQAAVAMKHVSSIWNAIGLIHEAAKTPRKDGLSAELATNALKVAEADLARLCKTLGIETDSAAERDRRYADLRAANMRVHELERQLGASQGPDVTQAALKVMTDRLNYWWDLEGFGHISDISFGQYGCEVKFSCNPYGEFRLIDSPTPISDKERKAAWHQSLRDKGFVLVKDDGDTAVSDCDASRKTLCDLFMRHIPSALVTNLETVHRHRAGGLILRDVTVYIKNIADILQLPAKEKA